MPAPLVAAATYFGLPRLLGSLADKAAQSRYEDLTARGSDASSDTLFNLLSMVPRQSGIESTLETLGDIYQMGKYPVTSPIPEIEEVPPGYQVTRELPYDQGVVFNTPIEDFLKYGGTDSDSGLNVGNLLGRDFEQNQSFGQTSEPATEVRFDEPMTTDPITGMSTSETSGPAIQGGSGFAGGGLADILRMMYAKR